ncbi:MAG: hypothetical protein AAFY63_18715 [Cyanobacteria bacterium J06643_13]
MDCPKPIFYASNTSIISTVRELHSYFRNLQSYYKVLKGQITSKLEDTEDPEVANELNSQLCAIERQLRYVHILNNSASTVDEVINLVEIREEFHVPQEIIQA